MADKANASLGTATQDFVKDFEQLLDRHFGRLRTEVIGELGKVATAGASFGGGLGMTALGTILGGLGFVHLVHRVTGLPLWVCYAGSSAAACAAGAGLFVTGASQVAQIDVFPENGRTEHEAVGAGGR